MTDNINTMQHPQLSQAASTQSNAALHTDVVYNVEKQILQKSFFYMKKIFHFDNYNFYVMNDHRVWVTLNKLY